MGISQLGTFGRGRGSGYPREFDCEAFPLGRDFDCIWGAIHSTKISRNFSSKLNGSV